MPEQNRKPRFRSPPDGGDQPIRRTEPRVDMAALRDEIAAPPAGGNNDGAGDPVPKFLIERPRPEPGDMPAVARPEPKPESEADNVGTLAKEAVIYADAAEKEIQMMIETARREFELLERHGLELIATVRKERAEFNERAEQYIASASKIHNGMRGVFDSIAAGAKAQG